MIESLAAVFEGVSGTLRLQRFATPRPGPGEILVRVLGCTICGSDLHSIEGRRSVPTPTVLGHEIVGSIEAMGPGAPAADLNGTPLHPGQTVTWAIAASCGRCFHCDRGLPQKCLHAVKYGHERLRPGLELLGGMAEHCLLVRGTAVVAIPDPLPLEVACPASCATATVAAAIEAAGPLRGRTVCVFGAGLLGLTATAMVEAAGGTAIVVEPQSGRRRRALDFGARAAIEPGAAADSVAELTQGLGVDAVLELSGAETAWDRALPLLATGGRIILVGSVFPGPAVSFHPEQLVRRHLGIQGIHNYAPRHLQTAIQFLGTEGHRWPFGSLVDRWLPLAEVETALQLARSPDCIRVGLVPSQSGPIPDRSPSSRPADAPPGGQP